MHNAAWIESSVPQAPGEHGCQGSAAWLYGHPMHQAKLMLLCGYQKAGTEDVGVFCDYHHSQGSKGMSLHMPCKHPVAASGHPCILMLTESEASEQQPALPDLHSVKSNESEASVQLLTAPPRR